MHHVVIVIAIGIVLPLLFQIYLLNFLVIIALALLVHVLIYNLIESLLIIALVLINKGLLLILPFCLLNIALNFPILLTMILGLVTVFEHFQLALNNKDLGKVFAFGFYEVLES